MTVANTDSQKHTHVGTTHFACSKRLLCLSFKQVGSLFIQLVQLKRWAFYTMYAVVLAIGNKVHSCITCVPVA